MSEWVNVSGWFLLNLMTHISKIWIKMSHIPLCFNGSIPKSVSFTSCLPRDAGSYAFVDLSNFEHLWCTDGAILGIFITNTTEQRKRNGIVFKDILIQSNRWGIEKTQISDDSKTDNTNDIRPLQDLVSLENGEKKVLQPVSETDVCVCVCVCVIGVNEFISRSGPGEDENRPPSSSGPLLDTHSGSLGLDSIYSLHWLRLSLQLFFFTFSLFVFVSLFHVCINLLSFFSLQKE